MKNTVKTACCFFAVCIIAFLSSSCGLLNYSGYSGEHTDLYAVAVNNIFGVQGYLSNGEAVYDPEIHIVETDNYGRTLFFYSEYYDALDSQINYGMAFVVMQYSKDGYAYYYDFASDNKLQYIIILFDRLIKAMSLMWMGFSNEEIMEFLRL